MIPRSLTKFGVLVNDEIEMIVLEQQELNVDSKNIASLSNLARNAVMNERQLSAYMHMDKNGNPRKFITLDRLMCLLAVLAPTRERARMMMLACGMCIDPNYTKYNDYRKIITLSRIPNSEDQINEILSKYSNYYILKCFSRE